MKPLLNPSLGRRNLEEPSGLASRPTLVLCGLSVNICASQPPLTLNLAHPPPRPLLLVIKQYCFLKHTHTHTHKILLHQTLKALERNSVISGSQSFPLKRGRPNQDVSWQAKPGFTLRNKQKKMSYRSKWAERRKATVH